MTSHTNAGREGEARFTKGPWVVRPSHPSEGFNCFWIERGDGKSWQSIATADGYQSQPEREANAQLIASAPDLYEALKEARVVLCAMGDFSPKGDDTCPARALLPAIDAALLKAEGREP